MPGITPRRWERVEEMAMGRWYQLTFQQLQPLHIGAGKWGVVNETAIFIPGQTIWGALVNKYLIEKGGGVGEGASEEERKEKLQQIQKKFEKISNFFPAFSEDGEFLTPTYKEGEFGYLFPGTNGKFLSESEFRYGFVDTLLQTAIEPGSRRAKDESFHQMDYILPKAKNRLPSVENTPTTSLYWKGVIYLGEEESNFVKEGLELHLGGDSRYGVGLVKLVKREEITNNDTILKEWQLKNGEEVKISISGENGALTSAFYYLPYQPGKEFEGEVEIGLDKVNFTKNPPSIEKANYYFSVGTKISFSVEGELNKGRCLEKKEEKF